MTLLVILGCDKVRLTEEVVGLALLPPSEVRRQFDPADPAEGLPVVGAAPMEADPEIEIGRG